jgi:hypothetical protein
MEIAEIASLVECGRPSFLLIHPADTDPQAVCAAIAARVAGEVVTVSLASDHCTASEQAFLKETLLSKRLLLLIVNEARRLPALLVDAWESYRRNPACSAAAAAPGIRFGPRDATRAACTLGMVMPRGHQGCRPEHTPRIFIDGLPELGGQAKPQVHVQRIGRRFAPVSMKELCFLHHRDPDDAAGQASVAEILQGTDRRLTWADLQVVLQAPADGNMLAILEGFERCGRISAEQMDFAAEAIAFLSEQRPVRLGSLEVNASVYDALWSWGPWFEGRGCVFRGQRTSRWRQDSSLLRPNPDGSPVSVATLAERMARTQAFVDALAGQEQAIVGRTLTDDERLAIAQHYGLPTPLLDYTRSLKVAAFFATDTGRGTDLDEGDVGVIYYVRPSDPVAVAQRSAVPGGMDFAAAAGLSLGRLEAIQPDLPDEENRIARQEGVFISGFDSRALQRLTTGAIFFRQRPGETFEDPRLGITRTRLLSPDSRLLRIAESVQASPPTLPPRVAATRIPSDDFFDPVGLDLAVTLSKCQTFLDEFATKADLVEAGSWRSLRAILERHLERGRLQGRTDERATFAGELRANEVVDPADPVGLTLTELAEFAGLRRDELSRLLWSYRPSRGVDGRDDVKQMQQLEVPEGGPKSALALALGQFVVGLEHVRTVRGEVAQFCAQLAGWTSDEPRRRLASGR